MILWMICPDADYVDNEENTDKGDIYQDSGWCEQDG